MATESAYMTCTHCDIECRKVECTVSCLNVHAGLVLWWFAKKPNHSLSLWETRVKAIQVLMQRCCSITISLLILGSVEDFAEHRSVLLGMVLDLVRTVSNPLCCLSAGSWHLIPASMVCDIFVHVHVTLSDKMTTKDCCEQGLPYLWVARWDASWHSSYPTCSIVCLFCCVGCTRYMLCMCWCAEHSVVCMLHIEIVTMWNWSRYWWWQHSYLLSNLAFVL